MIVQGDQSDEPDVESSEHLVLLDLLCARANKTDPVEGDRPVDDEWPTGDQREGKVPSGCEW